MQKIITGIACWIFILMCVNAQEVDSIVFDSQMDTFHVQQKSKLILQDEKSIGDQLKKYSSLFIRNASIGGIQTISAQGLNPHHIQVLWNDVPVTSGMLGVSDLSLFSVGYNQQISYRLQAQELATGGLAGVVNIKDENFQLQGYSLGFQQSVGSFGQSLSKIIHTGQHQKHQWSISAGYERAKNDFPYLDYTVYPNKTKHLIHSQFDKWYLYPKWEWKINERNRLSIFQEILSNHREVPPFMVTPNNLANQEDLVARQMIKWEMHQRLTEHFIQGVYTYAKLYFDDMVMSTQKVNKEHLNFLRYNGSWKFHNLWKWSYGADVKYTIVQTENYKDNINEWGGDFHSAIQFQPSIKWSFKGLIKTTFRSELGVFFPYQLEVKSFLGKDQQWKWWLLNGRDVRYPSLNDRYWEPGGRLDLLPERNIHTSTGTSVKYSLGKYISSSSKLELFVNKLDDLIFWLPTNRGYSQPMNIGKVLAYGGTFEQSLEYSQLHHQFYLNISYSINRSGNMEKRFQSDRAQWKQLPYFPIHTGKLLVEYAWKNLKWNADAQLYSKRFVTRDGAVAIPFYHLFNTSISYIYTIKSIELEGKMSFNNLLDERYEEVRYRPMPGRNYLFTLFIKWTHEKK